MLLSDDLGIINLVFYYLLWFSFGLMLGVFILYYVMRKDIDNAHKQFEKERINRAVRAVNEHEDPKIQFWSGYSPN